MFGMLLEPDTYRVTYTDIFLAYFNLMCGDTHKVISVVQLFSYPTHIPLMVTGLGLLVNVGL